MPPQMSCPWCGGSESVSSARAQCDTTGAVIDRQATQRLYACFVEESVMPSHEPLGLRVGGTYNLCLTSGQPVLSALRAHRTVTGSFPDRLSELPMRMPCQRWVRGTLLEYQRTSSGFRLEFSDWLTSHSADETSSGFRASK